MHLWARVVGRDGGDLLVSQVWFSRKAVENAEAGQSGPAWEVVELESEDLPTCAIRDESGAVDGLPARSPVRVPAAVTLPAE